MTRPRPILILAASIALGYLLTLALTGCDWRAEVTCLREWTAVLRGH